ncbi:MAG: TRAP transporter small permease [Pseudomonadota bacterium]
MVEVERTGPLDLLTWSFSRVTMWGPAFIVAIILYEVIMRYFFAAATLWVNEMSLWVGGGIYLSAGLYAMQQRSHIRIFILYDMAPLWLRRVFDLLSLLCVCIFAFAVVYGGFGEAIAKFLRWETFGTAYDPPIPATTKPLVLLMMVFLSLQATSNLVRDWPSAPWVRQAFDLVVSFAIVALALWGLYGLFFDAPEAMKVPGHWKFAIFVFLTAAIVLVVIGLVMDFNKTPSGEPVMDELEEDVAVMRQTVMPDEVLAGNPPRADDMKKT